MTEDMQVLIMLHTADHGVMNMAPARDPMLIPIPGNLNYQVLAIPISLGINWKPSLHIILKITSTIETAG